MEVELHSGKNNWKTYFNNGAWWHKNLTFLQDADEMLHIYADPQNEEHAPDSHENGGHRAEMFRI